ncbi:hypothetical protein ACFYPB_07180 [Streptomyces olivaceoviridis]|uniref:hypothetical protein n=1 Tax=Streptomyces olivaceoviridis TaxID=1921 RepID=UPI0036CEC7C4
MSAEILRPGGDGADGAGPVAGPGTAAGSRLAFVTSGRLARAAGRGLSDFPLLDEEPPLPEHRGRLREPDAVGGPEPVAVPNALTGVTARLGLAATVNAVFGEPYGLARRPATLDHLGAGRAGRRTAVSADPRAAADVRSGGSPGPYGRAAELLRAARRLWGLLGSRGSAPAVRVPRPALRQRRRVRAAALAPGAAGGDPGGGLRAGPGAGRRLGRRTARPARSPATWLEEFVGRMVPLLQERGAFRTEYRGGALRSPLGLSSPVTAAGER